jgi:hypothetical protein
MTNTDLSSLASTPAEANDVRGSELRSIAGFGWYHRTDWPREDHVISLCTGHKYLTEKGSWKPGSGDMHGLPPASRCCVCNGLAPTPRMRNAPLKPNAVVSNTGANTKT